MGIFGKILCLATVGIAVAGCGIVEALKQHNNGASSTASTADGNAPPAQAPSAPETAVPAGDQTSGAEPAQATTGEAESTGNSTAGDAKTQGSAQAAPEPAAETAPPPPTSKPQTAKALPEPFDPDLYLGLDQAAVRQRLGAPETEGGKGQATVWSYSDRHCNFTISFYLDLNTDQQRSLTYDLQLEEARQNAVNLCLSERRSRAANANS